MSTLRDFAVVGNMDGPRGMTQIGLGVIQCMWVEFVVGFRHFLAPKGFSPGTPVFLSPKKSRLKNRHL